MADKKINWTDEQLKAIKTYGSDVLVTASAGTGKTAVLSGRCVDIIRDKSRCPSVWNVLVLTFTNAAAEQMRSRIAGQLNDEFLRTGDSHLRHQTILLQAADISTIHSFCKRLITGYFYKLGLDPTFRVIESDEQRLLKVETLEKTIDWAWRQSNLQQGLVKLLSGRDLRSDEGFLSNVIRLSDFLDSIVSKENWLERATALSQAVNPLDSSPGKKQKQIVSEKLKHILGQIRYAMQLYDSHAAGGEWSEKCEENYAAPVAKCIELLENGNWEGCSDIIVNYKKPTVAKPKDLPGLTAELIKKTVKNAVDAFSKLSDLAVLNPDYLDVVGGSPNLQSRILIELVKRFDRFYSRAKQEINCLDFADLEHRALELLSKKDDDENPAASETAIALRNRYKYIFVDEYQDINPVQQRILDLLSSDDNVFVVGDIKQSIYGFRGTEPEIFVERLKSASENPEDSADGFRVDLNANFRSSEKILDFVNKIFGRIMTSTIAHIDYDAKAELRIGDKRQLSQAGQASVELNILDEAVDDEGTEHGDLSEGLNSNGASARQRQAAMIAQRIRRMVGADTGKAEFEIFDKQLQAKRNVEYRDIAILLRSPANRVSDYVEILQLAGIPVSCQQSGGYFEATEVRDLISLLKVMDNPQRDIELAAVLRSPLMNITDSELARIRLHGKNSNSSNFYQCVVEYIKSGQQQKLAEKLKVKVDLLEQWRTTARRESLADSLWQIYRHSDYLSFVSALPNGNVRKANLLKLHDRAIQFEGFAGSNGIASLRRFIEFIEKLELSGQDWATAETLASGENAVRIMSVHKSKGLEFEVVFLAELNSNFKKSDPHGDCLVGADDTIGLRIIDHKANRKLSSLAHQVIAEEKLSKALAEEMRILYVALTRAKQKLILSACEKEKKCRAIILNGLFFGEKPLPDFTLRSCNNPLEWVLYGLCDQKVLHETFETGLTDKAVDDNLFRINFYRQTNMEQLSRYIEQLKKGKLRKPELESKKGKEPAQKGVVSEWRYEFSGATACPAKDSVTAATHRNDEFIKYNYSMALERKPKVICPPAPAEQDKGRLIGTATHLVIANLDLTVAVTKTEVEKTIEKLLESGYINAEIAAQINSDSIVGFFESEPGQLALNKTSTVFREWPFTFALPASEYKNGESELGDETIIIQGIIDMLIKSADGLAIIDFKTDHVTKNQCRQRAELYEQQLNLYAKAAQAVLKTETAAKWLYFLTPSCAVEID